MAPSFFVFTYLFEYARAAAVLFVSFEMRNVSAKIEAADCSNSSNYHITHFHSDADNIKNVQQRYNRQNAAKRCHNVTNYFNHIFLFTSFILIAQRALNCAACATYDMFRCDLS